MSKLDKLKNIKNLKDLNLVIAIVAVVYTLVVLVVPFPKTLVFFISLFFTWIALASQLGIQRIAFRDAQSVKSKFYGVPIARVFIYYGIAQLILGLVFMIVSPWVAYWIPFVLYVLLMGAAALGVIATDAMRNEIEKQDEKLKVKVSKMRDLQSKISALVSVCDNEEVQAQLGVLADEFRYSDPTSNEELDKIESEIDALIGDLQSEIDNTDVAKDLIKKLTLTLVERNRLCKLHK